VRCAFAAGGTHTRSTTIWHEYLHTQRHPHHLSPSTHCAHTHVQGGRARPPSSTARRAVLRQRRAPRDVQRAGSTVERQGERSAKLWGWSRAGAVDDERAGSRGSGLRGGQGRLWDSAGGRPAGCAMGKVVVSRRSGRRQGVQWTGGGEPVTRKLSAGRTGSGSRGAMGQVMDVWLPAGAASEQAALEQPASSGQAAAGGIRRAAV
jgi:hypothetical protein